MSNQQWNQGQGDERARQQPEGTPEQGQQAAQDWGQPRQEWGQPQQDWTQQPQTSATEWGQPQAAQASATEWGQQQPVPQGNAWTEQPPQPQTSAQEWTQAQPQPSAGDWHQAQQHGAQDWTQQHQGSAQDWTQQQQQWPAQQGWDHGQQQSGWDQNQQQGWDQNQQWGQQQGYLPAGAGQSAGQPQWTPAKAKKPSPFDFSFSKPTLPDAAGTIFLLGTVGLGAWWLFELLGAFSYVIDFPLGFFATVLGNAGLAVFGIMMLRAVLEAGVALFRKPDGTDDAEDTTAV